MTPRISRPGFLERAERAGRITENLILVAVLSAMILLGAAQIVLRNLFDASLAWGDEALRLMVLWVAMFGAVAASREDRHISIDVLSRVLPPAAHRWTGAVVHAFTAGIALVLAWYSWIFVNESREFGDRLFGDLPAWWFQSVLPVAFFLIAYRYVIWSLKRVRGDRTGRAAP